ncbi:YqgE/AlgH family protein [Methylocystis sp. L43]|uniref:YqgE/AlgH family protein n=1 Tax=unclassified Methylocystis TaxID=2625913 RepID=UPI0018C267A4|nr:MULTISPECIES: YqgE/AlgH family protein [unclassified Methylocystis]MBG0798310.1 YqgE/AlgH family protein [Methylocystis sp. L43]MBG0805784.1 YqgE/AlgH family protein [Methylocystis sp. H15]
MRPSGKKQDFAERVSERRSGRPEERRFLDGQLLIAMPSMLDQRFARSVIYLCAHSEEGAMGIVVNQPARVRNFPDLLVQLQVIAPQERISLPSGAEDIQVLSGGPVQTDRGFVLHTPDFFLDNSTLPIDDGVSLTATIDILRAIAAGRGPDRALLALGYAGWDPGQLEEEIQRNGWLNCPTDPALLFDHDLETKYARALRSIGVDPQRLSTHAGHA